VLDYRDLESKKENYAPVMLGPAYSRALSGATVGRVGEFDGNGYGVVWYVTLMVFTTSVEPLNRAWRRLRVPTSFGLSRIELHLLACCGWARELRRTAL
jgi:hypothetical protein